MTDTPAASRFEPTDPRLPERLRHVSPAGRALWFAGDPEVLVRAPRIGIVGSRQPRADAAAIAARIARDAARAGFVIVSGLARGVDGIAHARAVEADAPTIAVLAGGLASVHPVRNRTLARAIAGSATARGVRAGMHAGALGLVLSEYGAGEEDSHAYRFRERNRIIAALSDYLVVVQATHTSGSMITARHALELGVPIGVVPSGPTDSCYSGSLALIHEGADAVIDGASLYRRLEIHGIMQPGFAAAAARGAIVDPEHPGAWTGGGEHEQLPLLDHPLASFLQVPRTAEELAELADLTLRDINAMLLELEEEGLVELTDEGTWIDASVKTLRPSGGS